jgi:hypothetical protein
MNWVREGEWACIVGDGLMYVELQVCLWPDW